jgi:hypothetical protein
VPNSRSRGGLPWREKRWRKLGFEENVPCGNQLFYPNYGNFNLSYTMLIQRRAHGRWEG